MITALITAAATTAFGAFTEGVCAGLAAYSLAKGVGKTGVNFKK